MISYAKFLPIQNPVPAERQTAKRHYGVHPYFTRRPHNVVRRYILHYSRERDRILDPFGGSGVTAIEAYLENRIGIQNDINPLANFIAEGVADLSKGEIDDYRGALSFLKERCAERLRRAQHCGECDIATLLRTLPLPTNITLPGTSDVRTYHELFTPTQLASLAILRQAVDEIDDRYARKAMLLAWSATLTKLNKTFLSAEGRAETRGGSSIFSIYRYKVAAEPVELPAWQTFEERALNVIEAKAEIDKHIQIKQRTGGWHGEFIVESRDIN